MDVIDARFEGINYIGLTREEALKLCRDTGERARCVMTREPRSWGRDNGPDVETARLGILADDEDVASNENDASDEGAASDEVFADGAGLTRDESGYRVIRVLVSDGEIIFTLGLFPPATPVALAAFAKDKWRDSGHANEE